MSARDDLIADLAPWVSRFLDEELSGPPRWVARKFEPRIVRGAVVATQSLYGKQAADLIRKLFPSPRTIFSEPIAAILDRVRDFGDEPIADLGPVAQSARAESLARFSIGPPGP